MREGFNTRVNGRSECERGRRMRERRGRKGKRGEERGEEGGQVDSNIIPFIHYDGMERDLME